MGDQQPEVREIDLNGPVAYREWVGPDGPTFVCVHGLGGSSLNWLAVAPGLAGRGRVVAPDLAGFGLTPRDGRSSGLPANRRLLSAFIREVATPPVVLVGNSMGGAISVLQAVLEPDSIAGLVLTSPALPWGKGVYPAPLIVFGYTVYRMPAVGEWFVRSRATRMGPERLVTETFRMCCVDPDAIDPQIVRAHVEMARKRSQMPDAVPAFMEAARSLLSLRTRREFAGRMLDRVRAPALLIHGREDRLVPVSLARAAVRGRPTWRLEVFDSVGHIAMLEAPNRWLAAVDRWLDEVDVGGARPDAAAGR